MAWEKHLEELRQRRQWALAQGGEAAVVRQHAEGRLTIRERIEALVDAGSFQEIGMLAGRGSYEGTSVSHVTPAPYVGGSATIDGRPVAVGGEDFTVRGGSSAGLRRRKGGQGGFIEDLAFEYDMPLINLSHGAGGSVNSLQRGYAPLLGKDGFERAVELLGRAGKYPIVLAEPIQGLLINRLQHAILNEAYHLIERGICTAADIDVAGKLLLGPRMSVTGLIEQKDLSGLDTHALAQQELVPDLHHEGKASQVIVGKYTSNRLGTKTGTGFYDWRRMDVDGYRANTSGLMTEVLELLDSSRPTVPPLAEDEDA